MAEAVSPTRSSVDDTRVWMPTRGRSLAIRERQLLLAVTDTVLLALVAAVLAWAHLGPASYADLAIPTIVGWLIVGYFSNLYDLSTAARLRRCLRAIVQTGLIVFGLLLLAFYLSPLYVSRTNISLLAVMGMVMIGAWRLVYGRFLASSRFERRVVVVGTGRCCRTLLEAIDKYSGHGVQIVGLVSADGDEGIAQIAGYPVLGTAHSIWPLIREHAVEEVVLATDDDSAASLIESVSMCYERGITISLMPNLYGEVAGQVPVEHMSTHWIGAVPLCPAGGRLYHVAKRALDIVVSATGIVITSPLMAVIAILVRVSSSGPVLFRQTRSGLHGQPFDILKFRTMYADGMTITSVGRWLRGLYLDELPQFFQVLTGEMSLVGPRPKRADEAHILAEQVPLYRVRQSVRPGVTGWSQIRFQYAQKPADERMRLRYDLYYIQHQSFLLDLTIIARTLARVFERSGM